MHRWRSVACRHVPTVTACDKVLRSRLGRKGRTKVAPMSNPRRDLLVDTCGSLPPGGQERPSSPSYSELLGMVTRAVDKLGLDWEAEAVKAQSQSKLDDSFLTCRASALPHKPLPFFPDIHQEVSRSWKQPFSACITNAAAVDFATITDMVGHGYATMTPVEETLAEHLAPNSATAWKSLPLLPSKPCRVKSSLVRESYSAAGQTLHSMAVFQAYQVELLKELDEGEGLRTWRYVPQSTLL